MNPEIREIFAKVGRTWSPQEQQMVKDWVCKEAQYQVLLGAGGGLAEWRERRREHWHNFITSGPNGPSRFDLTIQNYNPARGDFWKYLNRRFNFYCRDEDEEQRKYDNRHEPIETDDHSKQFESTTTSPEKNAETEDEKKRLRQAILECVEKLSPEDRDVFKHRYMTPDGHYIADQDRAIKDIAEILNIGESCVKIRLYRARLLLRVCLKRKEIHE